MLKPDSARLTDAEVYAMVDALGDVGASLNRANPNRMRKIYDRLRLEMICDLGPGQRQMLSLSRAALSLRPAGRTVSVMDH